MEFAYESYCRGSLNLTMSECDDCIHQSWPRSTRGFSFSDDVASIVGATFKHMNAKRLGAMNQACGTTVWSNPCRLDLSDAHASYQAAKIALHPRVQARGLLKEPHPA